MIKWVLAILMVLAVLPWGTFTPHPVRPLPRQTVDACRALGIDDVKDAFPQAIPTKSREVVEANPENSLLDRQYRPIYRHRCTYDLDGCFRSQSGLELERVTVDVIILRDTDSADKRYKTAQLQNRENRVDIQGLVNLPSWFQRSYGLVLQGDSVNVIGLQGRLIYQLTGFACREFITEPTDTVRRMGREFAPLMSDVAIPTASPSPTP
jgi:hypothetical protein